jgi:hypothetical protein
MPLLQQRSCGSSYPLSILISSPSCTLVLSCRASESRFFLRRQVPRVCRGRACQGQTRAAPLRLCRRVAFRLRPVRPVHPARPSTSWHRGAHHERASSCLVTRQSMQRAHPLCALLKALSILQRPAASTIVNAPYHVHRPASRRSSALAQPAIRTAVALGQTMACARGSNSSDARGWRRLGLDLSSNVNLPFIASLGYLVSLQISRTRVHDHAEKKGSSTA